LEIEYCQLNTYQEAAMATMCHSKAWSLKVIQDVYWVFGDQVSKTPPTGMAMGHGSFMIYGKKNFITPMRMEMGFGIMWKISDETYQLHDNERKVRTMLDDMMELKKEIFHDLEEAKDVKAEVQKTSQMIIEIDDSAGVQVNTYQPKTKTQSQTNKQKNKQKKEKGLSKQELHK